MRVTTPTAPRVSATVTVPRWAECWLAPVGTDPRSTDPGALMLSSPASGVAVGVSAARAGTATPTRPSISAAASNNLWTATPFQMNAEVQGGRRQYRHVAGVLNAGVGATPAASTEGAGPGARCRPDPLSRALQPALVSSAR